MGISAGPYSGKPNPHAWMSADNALIYVDNIRDALVKYDPPHADTYRRNAEAYKEKIRQTMAPLQARLAQCRRINAGWSPAREPSLSGPRLWACANCICGRSMPDQQGTPATGAQGYRHHEERTHPDHLQRSTISDKPGASGGAGSQGPLRRRAVCRFAERRRRPGADLARPAARHHRKPSVNGIQDGMRKQP